jgi:hypothetical protein
MSPGGSEVRLPAICGRRFGAQNMDEICGAPIKLGLSSWGISPILPGVVLLFTGLLDHQRPSPYDAVRKDLVAD